MIATSLPEDKAHDEEAVVRYSSLGKAPQAKCGEEVNDGTYKLGMNESYSVKRNVPVYVGIVAIRVARNRRTLLSCDR